MMGNMPCGTKLYATFWTITERTLWKKVQSTETYTNWYNAVLGFSPKNPLDEGPATKESKNMVDYFEVQGALWRATSKDHPLLHYRDRKFISKYFARLYSTWNSCQRHPGSAASFLLVQDVSEIEQKVFFDKKIRFVFRKYIMTRGCYPWNVLVISSVRKNTW